jgi:hypothetical protein
MGKLITTYSSFEISSAIPAVAGGAPLLHIAQPQAVATFPVLMGLTRLRLSFTSAVASSFGLVGALTAGTPTAAGTHIGELVSGANGGYIPTLPGIGRMLTAWAVAPTIAGSPIFFRQDIVGGVIGNVLEWEWPENDPLTIRLERDTVFFAKGLVLLNTGVGACADVLATARWLQFSPTN